MERAARGCGRRGVRRGIGGIHATPLHFAIDPSSSSIAHVGGLKNLPNFLAHCADVYTLLLPTTEFGNQNLPAQFSKENHFARANQAGR